MQNLHSATLDCATVNSVTTIIKSTTSNRAILKSPTLTIQHKTVLY